MNTAKIAKLCNEIEDVACDISCITMNDIVSAESRMIFDKSKEIAAEISAHPKSNADRIRQMTDEELADFFCRISQCCGNDACMLCPIFEGCAQNVMCVERWLKQEVSEDDER